MVNHRIRSVISAPGYEWSGAVAIEHEPPRTFAAPCMTIASRWQEHLRYLFAHPGDLRVEPSDLADEEIDVILPPIHGERRGAFRVR
jgi:hypothetical protein